MVSSISIKHESFYLALIICFYILKWFQVLQSNTNNLISPIDETLSVTTTTGRSGPGSNGNEEVLHIPRSSRIIEFSPSDALVPYTRTLIGRLSYLSAEMQSAYSTAQTNWTSLTIVFSLTITLHWVPRKVESI